MTAVPCDERFRSLRFVRKRSNNAFPLGIPTVMRIPSPLDMCVHWRDFLRGISGNCVAAGAVERNARFFRAAQNRIALSHVFAFVTVLANREGTNFAC